MASELRDLKRMLGAMRAKIDSVLTAAEKRKLLKDIATGRIKDPNELRRYVGRIEVVKKKKVKEQTATLGGKVIDAQSRQTLGGVDVMIQQTNFKEKTDNSGNFIWENLVKGRTIRINASVGGYKPNQTEYQATTDNEQFVVIKMVPVSPGGNRGGKDKKKGH